MATNDLLSNYKKPDLTNGIVSSYSDYLATSISEMKFIDLANLKEWFMAHLSIFFSEAISDANLIGYDGKLNAIKKENEQLAIDRAEMEEELNRAKSRLREHKHVDTEWMARCAYAYKLKGIRIQSNCREIGLLAKIIKKNTARENMVLSAELDMTEHKLFILHVKEVLGADRYQQLWDEVRKKHNLTKPTFNQ